jgi:hypothetical protein
MRIVINVDLLRLKAHDELDSAGNILSCAFGLSFAPVVYRSEPGDPPIPPIFTSALLNAGGLPQMRALLTQTAGVLAPWCWSNASIQVYTQSGRALQIGADVIPIDLPSGSDLQGSDLDTIEQNIVAHCVYASASSDSLTAPSQDLPPNAFCYPAFIQSAAAWPAPVPHGRFNFVKFFRVKTSSLGSETWIVAIPTFAINANIFKSVRPPSTNPPLPSAPPSPYQTLPNTPANMVDYYYTTFGNLDAVSLVLVQARCPQCAIMPPVSTSSFIDLDSLWVRPANPRSTDTPAISGDPWFEELPDRLAKSFDLPACLLNALGQMDLPTPRNRRLGGQPPRQDLRLAIINQERDAASRANLVICLVLRALHDCLGSVAPLSLQGDVAGRLIGLLPDTANGTDISGFKAKLLTALQVSLPLTLQSERDPSAWRIDTIQNNPWIARLAARLSAISDLPADPSEFFAAIGETTTVYPSPTRPFLLDRLMSVVSMATSPEVLTDLMVDTWGAVGPNDTTGTAAALQALELAIDLRGTIAQKGLPLMRARRGVMQPAWGSDGIFQRPTSSDSSDLALLGQNAPAAFAKYGLGTLAEAGSVPEVLESSYATGFVRTALLKQNARDTLRVALQNESALLLGKDLTKSSVLGAIEDTAGPGMVTPGGITLQVDRLVRGPRDPSAGPGDDDFHQNLAGYGILVKLVDSTAPLPAPGTSLAGTWRALNIMNIGIGPQNPSPPAPGTSPVPPPPNSPPPPLNNSDGKRVESVVPLTPVFDDQALPTAAVHYDNAPIVGVANIIKRPAPMGEASSYYSEPVIVPLQPLPSPSGDTRSTVARLPFLAFGTGVQFASFVITNHGALPAALAPDFPALLATDQFSAPPPDKIGPANQTLPFSPYLRRVAVGPLGLPENITGPPESTAGATRGPAPSYNAFSFDPSVRLLTDELVKNDTALTSAPTSLTPITLKTPNQRPMPRALLLHGQTDANEQPKNNASQIALRAPSADIEVFDRWIAFDEFTASNPTRQQAIRDYRKKLRAAFDANSLDQNKTKNNNTYSIGDPAIALFYARAKCIFRNGTQVAPPAAEAPVAIDWSLSIDQLLAQPAQPESTHRKPQRVALTVVDDPSTAPRLSNKPPLTLAVAEGEVWIVEVFSGVAMDMVNARCDKDLMRDKPEIATIGGKDYWLVAPFIFTVECASRLLPASDEIFASFTPRVSPDDMGNIEFLWQRAASTAAAAVGAVDVGWQQWRSTGRPPSPFPYEAIGNLDVVPTGGGSPQSYPVLWDIEAFAERPEEASKGRRFEPKLVAPQQTPVLGSETPSPAEPARYARFTVTVESRYANLYDPPLKPVSGAVQSGDWPTQWKRVFRPAMPKTVPALNVRAVVPLTRSIVTPEANRSSPIGGVLMVVDGAFGESGGIAENIDIRVVQITRQLQGEAQPRSASEFGADPILRQQGQPVPDLGLSPALRVVGPIGHTFDIDALAPAFASSSFIIMPPVFAERDPGAGWMAKLRARRVIDPRGVSGYGQQENSIVVPPTPPNSDGSAPQPVLSPPVPLSGSGDLSLTFDSLTMSVGQTIAIALLVDRAGDQPSQSGASDGFPQTWTIVLAQSAGTSGAVTTTVTFANMKIAVSETPAAVRILIVTRRIQIDNQPVDRFDVTLEAIDSQGVIVRGGEVTFDDVPASGAVRGRFSTSGTTLPLPLKKLRAPLASDWSETGWTQFLPDTSVQILPVAAVPPQPGSPELQFSLQSGAASTIQVNATPTSPDVAWYALDDLAARKGKNDQGLVHFLLLTSTVKSFAGAEEAYVGLYVLKSGSGGGKSVQFIQFGDLTDSGLFGDTSSWRARILLVQADPRRWSNITTWLGTIKRPWDAFFGSETAVGSKLADANADDGLLSPDDARLRILTVFAPFYPE